MPISPRIKVCGISSLEEARLAVQLGANALGLDVCSGVRQGGRPAQLMRAARSPV